jgi:predicted O-linked N-acetylglucosamine transferase (SPINDLY family)
MEPILSRHDRDRFEVFCYADVSHPDDVTARLRALPVTWRDLAGIGHEAAAELVRADGIDILVDLGGHTRRSRLLVLARRPAPVQVTYLGYPNTTGLTQMDYRLTDAAADPPGESDSLHTEKLVRLPNGFLCYCPPADAPAPSRSRDSGIVFASFNNMAKVTPEAISVWARILASVPGSRLLLKNRALGDRQVARVIAEVFSRCGLDINRLELRAPAAATADHLAVYNEVDIALDTFPYNGTTTTCEALWMGVPVVTWTGDTHAARVGTSIFRRIGLPELVGTSPEEYVRIAVELAGDRVRLKALRTGMRERMEASPLLSAQRITADIEAAYQGMTAASR